MEGGLASLAIGHKGRESQSHSGTPKISRYGNADTEPETRSHFLGSTVMWAVLGDSGPTSSSLVAAVWLTE